MSTTFDFGVRNSCSASWIGSIFITSPARRIRHVISDAMFSLRPMPQVDRLQVGQPAIARALEHALAERAFADAGKQSQDLDLTQFSRVFVWHLCRPGLTFASARAEEALVKASLAQDHASSPPSSPCVPADRHPLRKAFVLVFKLSLAAVILWTLVAAAYYAWALTFDLSVIQDMPQRSVALDRDGKFYSRLEGENRVVAPYDQISDKFVKALITPRGQPFLQPPRRRSARHRPRHRAQLGGARQGASTITQQLARNSFPLGGRNIHRKLIEAALAFASRTELTRSRSSSLHEPHLFRLRFLRRRHCQPRVFRKTRGASHALGGGAARGLIRSRRGFSPFNNLPASISNRDVVLNRMRELNVIDSAQLTAALRAIHLAPKPQAAPDESWAMETIRRELTLVVPTNASPRAA